MEVALPEEHQSKAFGDTTEAQVSIDHENVLPEKSPVLGLCNGDGGIDCGTDSLEANYKDSIVTEETPLSNSTATKGWNFEKIPPDPNDHASLCNDLDSLPSESAKSPVGIEDEDNHVESPKACDIENIDKTTLSENGLENGPCGYTDPKPCENEVVNTIIPIRKPDLTDNSHDIVQANLTEEVESSSQKEELPRDSLSEDKENDGPTSETAADLSQIPSTDEKEVVSEHREMNSKELEPGHSVTCEVNQDKKEEKARPSVKKQKARKSCQPPGGNVTQSTTTSYQLPPVTKSAINVASFAKKTIKVTELESVLGIKTKSLDKMDAKTLDKLVLRKAQQQRAKIEGRLKQDNLRHEAKTVKAGETSPQAPASEPKARNSAISSKTKGKGAVSPNQLITQFMVREPPQNNHRSLLSKDTNSEAQNAQSDTGENFNEAASPSSKLVIDTGASPSGVSAYIAGQHLLSRSKKKKKVYKGKSGNYRLPGQKKASHLRRRESTDSGGTLKPSSLASQLTGDSSAGEYDKAEEMEEDFLCDDLPDLDGDVDVKPYQATTPLQSPLKKRKYSPRMVLKEKGDGYGRHKDGDRDQTEKSRHTRKSSRKRKLLVFNDDTESTISTETYGSDCDSSATELDGPLKSGEEDISTEEEQTEASKRRKVVEDAQNKDDLHNTSADMGESSTVTIPHLSPIKAPTNDPSASKMHLSPPKISPALPFMGCSPRVGPVPAMEEKKPAESAAVPQELVPGHPYKFMNTPNGVSYPVTPPETPDSTVSSMEDKAAASGERDRDGGRLPVCFCRLPGNVFVNYKASVYCQALDSVDGKVQGCMNKVHSTQLLRPSVKIPFLAMCESHKQRLKQHQCCPGCGNFCTQGTFYQCKETTPSLTTVHYHHKQCQLHKDDKYFCPHCGDQSCQLEIQVQAAQSKSAAPVKYDKKDNLTNARMEFRRCSTDSVKSSHSGSGTTTTNLSDEQTCAIPPAVTPSLRPKFQLKIDATKFPIGPCKKDLEKAIQQFSCEEKKKKFRASNKNLYQACKSNDLERVLYLLCEGIDANEKFEEHKQQSSIHVAASKGFLAIVHLLVQAKASVHAIDEDLRTALMYAAEEGHTSVVRYLLKCQAVPDARASDGMTPLHLAAQSGEVEAVQYIVQTRMIDVNIKDDGGWTPMIWAAEHRHIDTVRFLLEVGSDPNLRDNEDNTGLHWAVYSGSTDIAELFLNAGCDMEAANEHGDRPLHIATRQGHYECVVLLLARGADSLAVNNRNDNPLNCYLDETSPIHMAIQVNQQLKKVASQIKRPPRLLHRDVTCGKEQYPIAIVNEYDDENYPTDYLYVNDYVETVHMNINRVITSLRSCECRDNCVSLSCECSRNSVKCWYTDEGKLPDDFNYSEPPYVFECNKACKCWASCQNRVVQMGISVRLQVFRAEGKGWGVRSLLEIPKGTYVCEYIGEVLSDAEADRREDDSYLFDLDNRDSDSFCIDARQYGNVSRFINHRCEPNLSPVKVFVDHQDLRFPRICFFANKDIKAYEELGFDYGDKFWVIKYKQFTCTCDSNKCRYSKDSIHKTVAEYYRRIKETEESDG